MLTGGILLPDEPVISLRQTGRRICHIFIVSLPDQNAIKALLVGGVRIGQEKRIGRRVVGDEQRSPSGRTQVGGHLNVVILIGSADRKSTRLNSSHLGISYAVFCLT